MTDDDDFLTDAFRRQLGGLVTPEAIRAIERGSDATELWRSLDESGFADAMLPESAGGAGLGLAQAFPLILAAGEYCVPAPFAETMVARAMLGEQGVAPPSGAAILLAPASAVLPGAGLASHALVDRDGVPTLVAIQVSGDDLFRLRCATAIEQGEVLGLLAPDADRLMLSAAAVTSALMAGAMGRVLEMSLRHAGERQQFGRSLGKFQAIQQQLAVLAEQVLSAQVAARNAFVGTTFELARVAAAKCRANEAASHVCNIAHAIHGAIGATEEFDLQLYTRRLKLCQLAFGSESYWGARLGHARIASGLDLTSDFLRLRLGAEMN
ncbi:acyl-CoA dehydrogenase family protein [Sphingobium sp. R-21]|uniref:acyl-CoA dehydrogenase family protein n=1 Tax=Sphingobium sp. R-21 TaxID=3404056 RepID=UPI003CEB97DF